MKALVKTVLFCKAYGGTQPQHLHDSLICTDCANTNVIYLLTYYINCQITECRKQYPSDSQTTEVNTNSTIIKWYIFVNTTRRAVVLPDCSVSHKPPPTVWRQHTAWRRRLVERPALHGNAGRICPWPASSPANRRQQNAMANNRRLICKLLQFQVPYILA